MENYNEPGLENQPDIKEISHYDSVYPQRLRDFFGSSMPESLYVMGNLDLMTRDGIGFSGSRKAEEKALDVARECARQTVEAGMTVVSGYAAGIDMTAHLTALEESGSTIIVLPEGIGRFRIKKDLRDAWDWSRTLVVSQFTPDASWQSWRAMERNKTIIAISKAVIVVSAGEKGGTLNTGLSALKHGASLYVADFGDANQIATGNLHLISKGAKKFGLNRSMNRPNLAKLFDEVRFGLPRQSPVQESFL